MVNWFSLFRFIAEKVRPLASSTLSEDVSQVFKEAEIDCERSMSEQVRVAGDNKTSCHYLGYSRTELC